MGKKDEAAEKARGLYRNGCHCCEAVVLAVNEYYGNDDGTLFRISTPFGGGLSGNGAVCGSLAAAFLCLGYYRGRTSAEDSRSGACEPAGRIYRRFLETYGTTECRDIIGYDRKDPKAVELYAEKTKREICVPLTGDVTRWILEELEGCDARD